MNTRSLFAVFGVVLAFAGHAAVRTFPSCEWSAVRVSAVSPSRLAVVDAAGRGVLSFHTEGGDFAGKVVVSGAVDRLVIDARAAFAAGMRKLVFTSPDIGPKEFEGRDCTLVSTLGGVRGSEGLAYFEGHGTRGHYYRSRKVQTKGRRKDYSMAQDVWGGLNSLHLRWDLTRQSANGPFEFYGAKYAVESELPVVRAKEHVAPKLIFHAPFDGTAEAKVALGDAKPCRAQGLSYAEGKRGQAVRLCAASNSVLEYLSQGNLVQKRGCVSLWFKREWPDDGRRSGGGEVWRTLFANPEPPEVRVGSGQLWFWCWGSRLRADMGDDDDSHVVCPLPAGKSEWTHLAVNWDDDGVRMFVNGRGSGRMGDSESPMQEALRSRDPLESADMAFRTFFVGGKGTRERFDGLVDDLRIYSAPLSKEQISEIYRREAVVEMRAVGQYAVENVSSTISVTTTSPAGCDLKGLRYCIFDGEGRKVASYGEQVGEKTARLVVNLPKGLYTLSATDGKWNYGDVPIVVMGKGNPYELAPEKGDVPGRPRKMELVSELRMDGELPPDRFRAVGATRRGSLGGVPYLEAGPNAGDRFAMRFKVDPKFPLWCFEIDYPDDARRTADIIVQRSGSAGGDYTLQVGYAAGDEYPNTGRTLTHRCLYWASDPDVTLVAMTANKDAPAAVSAVRVYRVVDGALPAAAINEPKPPSHERRIGDLWRDIRAGKRSDPPSAPTGWNRMFALYFEDPAIAYDFAAPACGEGAMGEMETMIDRTIALMKYTGENMFAYPGAWYHGLIGEQYNPRGHAPDFLSAWYAKFDEEGLSLMPTVNPNTMPVPAGLVTRETMSNGALHDSCIAIHDTGKPNWGGWHDTPPNFNFHHPAVRKNISTIIGTLTEQGLRHPSFKGVCMHMTRHCMLWFGDERSGYNDYTVKAFAKAKGLKIPVDSKDPLRGRAYAEWLRANAWQDWIQWRCDIVTDFYVKEARKLAERRPDLKLWLNSFVPANIRHPDFANPDYMEQANRACGLDRDRLTREAPNVILCQTLVPADYRFRRPDSFPSKAAHDHQRVIDTLPGFYSLLKGANYPWVNQHDRYWESPIGRGAATGNSLSCSWLRECAWRVTTINPSGVNALRHFVLPLRYGDVLGVSKGGFLIGTYGMEERLVPFAQAFRALPGVVFDDVGGTDVVKLRQKEWNGRSWFYVVNTDLAPATVSIEFPSGTEDLVSGEGFGGAFSSAKSEIRLAPYQMRSFSAPKGLPVFVK